VWKVRLAKHLTGKLKRWEKEHIKVKDGFLENMAQMDKQLEELYVGIREEGNMDLGLTGQLAMELQRLDKLNRYNHASYKRIINKVN
jgi:hypothetical protein